VTTAGLGRFPKLPRVVAARESELLRVAQGNACAICHRLFDETRPSFTGGKWRREAQANVDHSHASGRVRGLLCTRCNRNVGWFESLRAEILTFVGTGE
jgi:hypothetical protein